ncbi:MAG: phosphoglycerate dehydrogenase [Gammaproteobacteria bacterium]
MRRFSRATSELNVLLLEGVHDKAAQIFEQAHFGDLQRLPEAMDEDTLVERVRGAHLLGLRSRTRVTRRVIEAADELRAIGCFCIGTNQVDIGAARERGVPVFNAPFSNTRSVAELVLAESILLLRDLPRKNASAHRGHWLKSAAGSFEVRGKKLGIVGYGHIGTQVGLLAESLGMQVFYHDVTPKLALGNATPVSSLPALLAMVDIVTLHVPESPDTVGLIGKTEISRMPKGAALINASRGTVLDIDALVDALNSGHLSGAALDVFPTEPGSNEEEFVSPLRGLDNVLLTPHVGGSTVEAQASIGVEVADKLVRFNAYGSTVSAVNFPEVSLPAHFGTYRLLHIHRNQPGVLAAINAVFSESGTNISGEYLQTNDALGYVVVDFEETDDFDADKLNRLKNIDGTLRARIVCRD